MMRRKKADPPSAVGGLESKVGGLESKVGGLESIVGGLGRVNYPSLHNLWV